MMPLTTGFVGALVDTVVQTYITTLNTIRGGFPTLPFLDGLTVFALDEYVKGCKNDAIWSKMIEVNCVLWINGGTNNLLLAMIPLQLGPQGGAGGGNAWTSVNFVEGNMTQNGLVGVPGSSTAAHTGIQPSLTFKSQDNAGVSIYVSSWTATAGAVEVGQFDPDNTKATIFAVNAAGNRLQVDEWFGGAHNIDVATIGLAGFYSMNRITSTDFKVYFANSTNAFAQVGTSALASTAIPTTNQVLVWCCASGLNNPFAFTDRRMSYVTFHDGFTSAEGQKEFNRAQELRVNLGGGFV